MERLTLKEFESVECEPYVLGGIEYYGDSYGGEVINKLSEYEDLEEQGLLLKLPCKVGNIVYVLEPCHCYNNYKENQNCHHAKTKATKYIDVVRVPKRYDSRSNTKCVKLYERPFKMNYLTKFGKTVFLTKEEAEQALKQIGE